MDVIFYIPKLQCEGEMWLQLRKKWSKQWSKKCKRSIKDIQTYEECFNIKEHSAYIVAYSLYRHLLGYSALFYLSSDKF